MRLIFVLVLIVGFSTRLCAAAALPAGEVWAGGEPVEEQGPRRARICLHGVWRFQPAGTDAAPAEGEAWGAMRVPATWLRPASRVARGGGAAWKGFEGKTLAKAWYEREIAIPAAWAGRSVLLDVRRLSTDAVVFVDGVEVGRVGFPSGEVDLSAAVKPGGSAVLRLLVAAVQDQGQVLQAMGVGQNVMVDAKLATRGLIGEVFLISRPRAARIDDVFVRTSVRRGEIAVDVDLSEAGAGEVRLQAEVRDGQGVVAKRFVGVAAAGSARATISTPWADPRLWDVGQPNLYTLVLTASGAVDDVYHQEFGFRECWIEGRTILLNGTPFRMRPTSSAIDYTWVAAMGTVAGIDGGLASVLRAGFNIYELWPANFEDRGTAHFRELVCARADRLGVPVMANPTNSSSWLNRWAPGARKWSDPAQRAEYERRLDRELRRFRNHPSAVMWASSANLFGHADDQNPRRIGRDAADPVWAGEKPDWKEHIANGNAMVAMVKRLDPTRPVLVHQGGPVGDIYALNNYLDLMPLQEREEWLSDWAESGDMPYTAVEHGMLHCDMMRGRLGFGENVRSEPLLTEFTAMFLGREAYALEQADYRARIVSKYEGEQLWSNWHKDPTIDHGPAYQSLQVETITRVTRAWRTMGITGGMVPWDHAAGWLNGEKIDQPRPAPGTRGAWVAQIPGHVLDPFPVSGPRVTPAGHALIAVNGPTLAWIAGAGAANDRAAFTAKDHSFRVGTTLRKQIALLNDSRAPAAFAGRWTVTVAGAEIAAGELAGSLAVGETRLLPIAAELRVAGEGTVSLRVRVAERAHEDGFPFRVFPSARVAAIPAVALHDPAGASAAMLTHLGQATTPWTGAAPRVLVIGRGALSAGALPGDLEAYVRAGGRALVLGQDPAWLEQRLGLRVAAHLLREVWPMDGAHPVVAGLDARDLADWSGTSTLLEQRPDYTGPDVKRSAAPWWGWRWGGRHAVTSAAIEKPHRSGWRPLLECGFDLAWSPLMEIELGQGRLTLCTLDLEDHVAADPAAERLARNLLAHVANAMLPKRAVETRYVGGDAGAALLDAAGVRFIRGEPAPGDLLVIGPEANADLAAAHLDAGGRVLVLAHPGDPGLGLRGELRKAHGGSLAVPDWVEAAGLSPSDLRRRVDGPVWTITDAGPGGAIGADGLLARVSRGRGVAIFCQLDPAALDADRVAYQRLTRWRMTRAIAQLASNLGAAMATDGRFFTPIDAVVDDVALAGDWKQRITVTLPAATAVGQHPDPGLRAEIGPLLAETVDDAAWATAPMPGPIAALADADGEAVLRRGFTAPAHFAGRELELELGAIDDFDDVLINGVRVGGRLQREGSGWNVARRYVVPAGVVRPGANTIAIRVFDHFGGGGLGGRPSELRLRWTGREKPASWYHPDYREDHARGDDPYRYFRW